MLQTFIFSEVAVVVRHWFEVGLETAAMEHGVRIELRLLEQQPHRGTESASQRFVLDRPLWRADLFDRLDAERGNFHAAHYHPRFDGVEPCPRVWSRELSADPFTWLQDQLSDISAVAEAAGASVDDVRTDADDVRDEAPAIVEAAKARAATRCTSVDRCFTWTSDVSDTVKLMVENLQVSQDLLDKEHIKPWLLRAG